ARLHQWLEAAAQWQQTLNLNPSHEEAQRAIKKAEKEIQSGSRRSSIETDIDKHYQAGVSSYISGRYDLALREWKKVQEVEPDHPFLREYMAQAKNKLLEQELGRYKNQKQVDEDTVAALSHRAYTLYSLGHVDDAIKLWKQILSMDPTQKDAREA